MSISIHHDEDVADGTLRKRFGVLASVISLCFVVLLGRLFWLQIVEGDTYRERAKTSFTVTDTIPARRGLIKDRQGDILAKNVAAHQLTILPHSVEDAAVRKATLNRLADLLELTHDEVAAADARIVDALTKEVGWQPVVIDDHLVSDHCPFDGAELTLPESPPADGRGRAAAKGGDAAASPALAAADAEHQLFCHECGLAHEPIAADATYCPHDKTKLEWMGEGAGRHATCPKCKRSFVTSPVCPVDGSLLTPSDRNLVCPVCRRRFSDEVAVLRAHLHDMLDEKTSAFPGVAIETEFMREYTRPSEFAHPLGYMNLVTKKERDEHPGVYALDAHVGRSGVEKALEPILRGEPGSAKYLKGTDRSVMRDFEKSTPGQDVWLTIDARLQRAVRDILRYERSAAAVVLDPQTGEVLAMYSHPGYDPNRWSGRLTKDEWNEVSENPFDPLHNKAVTAYAPGSVFKIVTALAALREGVVTADSEVNCPGYYEYGGRKFGCHYKPGHGAVNLVKALMGSCDVYFYIAAEHVGMDKLAEYARELGFGQPTGIEIPESVGLMPTREWLDAHTALGFQPGLTLSAGIGQGQVVASPLQIARAFAAIANGGRLVQPHLVMQYTDEIGQVVQKFLPVDERRIEINDEQLALIREGLFQVVNSEHGTAYKVHDKDLVFAGKTGTAEAAQTRPGVDAEMAQWLKDDHAWFALYAPAPPQVPQVVITVFVEHGGSGGHDAAPLAKAILDAWKRLGLYHAPVGGGDDMEPSDEHGVHPEPIEDGPVRRGARDPGHGEGRDQGQDGDGEGPAPVDPIRVEVPDASVAPEPFEPFGPSAPPVRDGPSVPPEEEP